MIKFAVGAIALASVASATAVKDDDEIDCTLWVWEECSWMYYRHFCGDGYSAEDGVIGDCGWFYWDDWNLEEFFVTCDEFNEWSWCW